jgi:hypothetical protein
MKGRRKCDLASKAAVSEEEKRETPRLARVELSERCEHRWQSLSNSPLGEN